MLKEFQGRGHWFATVGNILFGEVSRVEDAVDSDYYSVKEFLSDCDNITRIMPHIDNMRFEPRRESAVTLSMNYDISNLGALTWFFEANGSSAMMLTSKGEVKPMKV